MSADDSVGKLVSIAKPYLPNTDTIRLGRIIHKAAVRHHVDEAILTSIIAHESSFRSNLYSCWLYRRSDTTVYYTCDIGISQINWETWGSKWHLNPCRLRSDDAYNIDIAAKILAGIKVAYGHEEYWWSRYYNNRPSKRAEYETMVNRFLGALSFNVVAANAKE